LQAADLDVRSAAAARWWAAAALAGAIGGWTLAGPVGALLGLVAAGLGPVLGLRAAAGRSATRVERELPGLVDELARALRSGASLPAAVAAAAATDGPAAAQLARLHRRTSLGHPFPAAVEAWTGENDSVGLRLVGTALVLADRAGGASALAVDGVAVTLRERNEARAEAVALAAQARLSALVIGVAPVGFALLATASDPRTAAFLLRTPTGLGCLAAGLGLDVGAAWWMHRIVRRVA